jgi:hypothetical protein
MLGRRRVRPGRPAPPVLGRGRAGRVARAQAKGGGCGPGPNRPAQVAVALHPGQRQRPPGPGRPGMAERVVGRRGPDQPRQQRRLGQAEPVGPGREVGLGGRLHPIGALPEIDSVEVRLEDGLLAVAPLQPPGVPGLSQLAPQRPLARDIAVLHILLRDGRPALDHPPPLQVPSRRPGHSQPVDPAVPPEPRILGVHRRQPHPPADLPQPHRRPILRPVQRRHHPPVRVQHQRRLRHPIRRHQVERPHRHTPGKRHTPDKQPPGPAAEARPAPLDPGPGGDGPGPVDGRCGVVHGKVIVGIRGGRLHPCPC